jgi:class 3 adenylate cyclase/tetratricopeptide (TPR) repeat protein
MEGSKMNCPKCQFENREGAKFCGKCGHKFEITCPECGTKNQAKNNFCDECGSKLSLPLEQVPKQISFDEKLTKIQKYLPKGLTKKILSHKDRIEGERKQVTVMFCDMAGFTALVEKLGPENAYEIMDQVYEILIHKVHEYEGTVNEMTGDGVMALFGAPIALEDAPQRAIRSAMAIHRELAKFSKDKKGDYIRPLKMRIGIHTGPVVVGTLGNDLRVDFKAVGDTVNIASRVETLAESGATYVTGDTFNLTEGLFRFEALGEKRLKGKKESVRIYRVITTSSRRTRFDVSAERGLTPFIGRERELELLLDGFERSKAGMGQAFSIMAEAGVGKSRLLYELRKIISNEDITFLEGKCLSYSRNVPYHPVLDILKANFNIEDDDEDSVIKEKIKVGLDILKVDEQSTLPYLLEILSVKDSGITMTSMSPDAKRDRIIEAVKRITLKGSEIRPLIIATEDLHWIDKSSEEYYKNLIDSISGARVFLIFTYRPEFVHMWGGRSYHNQVNLNRLSNRESLSMASHLLGSDNLDMDLENLILDKAEGVPFFIEEFIRSLKNLKLIEARNKKYHLVKNIQNMAIPATINDVIMARVDSLPEDAKKLLQIGSAIEREFQYGLIKHLTGISEKALLSHLSVLRDTELLYERGLYPESTYLFKHALTREVVYNSILTKQKKRLHGKIGKAVEALYKENIDEFYEVMAKHFIISENFEKGAEYSKQVAKKAEKAVSLNAAIAYSQDRISCLEKLPQTENVQNKIIDARTILGLYYLQMTNWIKAKEAIDPIIDLAITQDYKRRLSQIYTIMGAHNMWIKEDIPAAIANLNKAETISEEVNDFISLVLANYNLGGTLSYNSEFDKSDSCFKKAIDINMVANNLWGVSSIKGTQGMAYFLSGRIDLCHQTSAEATSIAEESGDIYSKALAYTGCGISLLGKGLFKEAKKYLIRGIDFCKRINLPMFEMIGHLYLAETYFLIKEYQKSKAHYVKAITICKEESYMPSILSCAEIDLIKSKAMDNDLDIDFDSLYQMASKIKLNPAKGKASNSICAILLSRDNHISEAEKWITRAIETNKKYGLRLYLAIDYGLYAELSRRKGDQSKAKENLNKAIEIFKQCGADGWVEKYEKEKEFL